MAMDVAEFAKRLREDGIDAAKSEAEGILAEARTRASALEAEGRASVDRMLKEAEARIATDKKRAEAEVKLISRDLILGVKRRIEEVTSRLLKERVSKELSSPDTIKSALLELLRGQKTGAEWEMSLGPTVGKQLTSFAVNELFKSAGAVGALTDGLRQEGFTLRNRNEVLEVAEDSVTSAFQRLMSVELRKVLDASSPTIP
ncbi:MAG: hypothetical protein WA705_10560 [Candidatus Ozemobacteraceae bacterium]